MSYTQTLDVDAAFARYETLRPILPTARFPAAPRSCAGLLAMADHVDAFVLDSFGVLNVGETAIPGTIDCLAALRARGKRLVVLTNAASYTHATAVARYARLGFDFAPSEVVSSRDVCLRRLDSIRAGARWGAIAATDDRFEDVAANVARWTPDADVDAILFLSSATVDDTMMTALAKTLGNRPLAVANPDLVAPRETGLSKEPGYYACALAERLGIVPHFFGKPFGPAFDDALATLDGIPRARIAMVGDTLHTDILGGAAAGLRTVLVTADGLFAGRNVDPYVQQSGIIPDFICPRI